MPIFKGSGGSRHSPHSQWRMSDFTSFQKLLKGLFKLSVISKCLNIFTIPSDFLANFNCYLNLANILRFPNPQ